MNSSSLQRGRSIAVPWKAIPKGWYWMAALAVSLAMWSALIRLGMALLQ